MTHLYTPRPWLFTILFFVLVLDIVMQARLTGRARELAWLPLIFALWANTHIQFIDGIRAAGLGAGRIDLRRAGGMLCRPARRPIGWVWRCLEACWARC